MGLFSSRAPHRPNPIALSALVRTVKNSFDIDIILYYIILYYIKSYHIIYHVISYLIISHHIISCHILSYHITSYHITSYHVIFYHIISYHIISYHIISYHILPYVSFFLQKITGIDLANGIIHVHGLDLLEGTPVLGKLKNRRKKRVALRKLEEEI